ncbi:unnamed protein product [Paramecium pentaurelia]|uniref:Uncharacterized protein n=1 Tax=Paramecium pentaurelia TaxID=43138 RepID=A0A8S1UCM1_9CILI|nr:unnamed protein product [Paramecium pentaurelia]
MQGSFQVKETLADIFDQVKDVDIRNFGAILEILRKEKAQDGIGFLSDIWNQRKLESQILQQVGNLAQADTEQQLSVVRNEIKQITEVLRKLKDHDFNKIDYSFEENEESTQSLINSIKDYRQIFEFLQFLVHLTSIDETLIQVGSNSLHLLVQMKVDLSMKNLENIKIQNTSLVGANFVRCNFSGSQFHNVNISGIKINGALLLNCQWKNLKIKELNIFHGHTSYVNSVCFSPDGNTLASGSVDQSIRLWDVQTGQQKAKLDGHNQSVNSVCFSPDGNELASCSNDYSIILWDAKTRKKRVKIFGHTSFVQSVCFSTDGNTLASGSRDKSIRLWDVKTGLQKAKLDGHSNCINSVCFSPDGNTLASGSNDKSIRLWDVKTGLQKAKLDGHSEWVIVNGSHQSVSLLMSIRLWDVQNGKEIQSADKKFKDILAKFKAPIFSNNPLPESNNITILRISQTPLFQAQGALILKGEFINYEGYDLRSLFKSLGSCILEDFKQK